jgi:uncharacterized protein YxjI
MIYFLDKKLWAEGNESAVTTELGDKVLRIENKRYSLKNTILIYDRYHVQLGSIDRKLFSSSRIYHITYDERIVATVTISRFFFFAKRYKIVLPDGDFLSIKGDIDAYNYDIKHGKKTVARVTDQAAFREHQYALETNEQEYRYVLLCAAILLSTFIK